MKAKVCWLCVCVLTVFAVSPVCAQETDVLLLRNGDELTGELKGLQRGQVTYKTDGMSTVYVKWPRVVTATTDKQFEIRLEDGRTYFGSLKASDTPHRVIIRSSPDTLEVPTQSVVQLTRLGNEFWRRLSGSLSLGFDFTQQNSKVDLSTSATVAYAIELHRLELTFDGSFSRQDEASTISRRDLELWWARKYSKVWFRSVAVQKCVAAALDVCPEPELPDPSLFCNETYCSSDPAVNEECTAVFTVCAAESLNAEECVAAALISCQADPDGSLFCNETYCSADPAVNEECSTFFAACLAENPEANAEECAAGALGVCRDPSLFCDAETCVDPAKQQQCTTDLAACIAGANGFDYDECIAASFLFCRT